MPRPRNRIAVFAVCVMLSASFVLADPRDCEEVNARLRDERLRSVRECLVSDAEAARAADGEQKGLVAVNAKKERTRA